MTAFSPNILAGFFCNVWFSSCNFVIRAVCFCNSSFSCLLVFVRPPRLPGLFFVPGEDDLAEQLCPLFTRGCPSVSSETV